LLCPAGTRGGIDEIAAFRVNVALGTATITIFVMLLGELLVANATSGGPFGAGPVAAQAATHAMGEIMGVYCTKGQCAGTNQNALVVLLVGLDYRHKTLAVGSCP
jgi:hypothetical protein